MKKITLWFGLLLVLSITNAMDVPFKKGVNLTGWFQTSSAQQVQFTSYTKQDFIDIKSLGVDVIRLPINLHYMTSGAPDYKLDPVFCNFLDQVIAWTEELGIYLILDNHTLDATNNSATVLKDILLKVWSQMAERYKDKSTFILYEVLNEPFNISDASWNSIQAAVVDKIREIDKKHTIIIGPASYNSYNNLQAMPDYADTNLIYTFHFYDPFLYTHQGADWTDLGPLSGVPFPYNADSMPVFPDALKGTWVESSFKNYNVDGTVDKVKQLIDIAVNFGKSRNVPIYCGEFGVYKLYSKPDERAYWYEVVRKYLEENNIPWTIWDYHGGFGVYNDGGNDLFHYDLNVPMLQALGFNVPEQGEYIVKPDSVGFPLYTDYIEQGINASSYGGGEVNYYSTESPNNGNYCISYKKRPQYTALSLDFVPNKDLSKLVAENYAIDFLVRGNTHGKEFQIRFLDTKTGPDDHPWRMASNVTESSATWDNRWQHVRIPLSSFMDVGSWDGTWFNPEGKFDWTAIDKFEISAETDLSDANFWFDNIVISNMDTTAIYDTAQFIEPDTTGIKFGSAIHGFSIFPNPAPANGLININLNLQKSGSVKVNLIGLNGSQKIELANKYFNSGENIICAQLAKQGTTLNSGIYILQILSDKEIYSSKLVLVR